MRNTVLQNMRNILNVRNSVNFNIAKIQNSGLWLKRQQVKIKFFNYTIKSDIRLKCCNNKPNIIILTTNKKLMGYNRKARD